MKSVVLLLALASLALSYVVNNGTSCYIYPESLTHFGQPVDDSDSIAKAFELCGKNGSVILTKNTFHIDRVMNTTNLLNCDVSLHGEMVWSDNIPYWLSHSYGVSYQNLSTAWLFGGTNVTFRGYGEGVFDGNGQTWYDQNRNNSNQPGRPISITFFNSTNLYIDGLIFRQSQFWSSFISYSRNVTMTNIEVNSVSNSVWHTDNTDGTDTWNSHDIVLKNWTVTNGDDCIAVKGNTTNLYAHNITCNDGTGIPIGSIGQYPTKPDYVYNISFDSVVLNRVTTGAYIKVWQGIPTNKTGNGDVGGGGGGEVKNVTFRNFVCDAVQIPIYVSQCIYGFDESVCDTSELQLSHITWENFTGTSAYNLASTIHCSLARPCPGLKFTNVHLETLNSSLGLPSLPLLYECANLVNQNATGSDATGIPCNAWAPGNVAQALGGNVLRLEGISGEGFRVGGRGMVLEVETMGAEGLVEGERVVVVQENDWLHEEI